MDGEPNPLLLQNFRNQINWFNIMKRRGAFRSASFLDVFDYYNFNRFDKNLIFVFLLLNFSYNLHSWNHFPKSCKSLSVRFSGSAKIQFGLVANANKKLCWSSSCFCPYNWCTKTEIATYRRFWVTVLNCLVSRSYCFNWWTGNFFF